MPIMFLQLGTTFNDFETFIFLNHVDTLRYFLDRPKTTSMPKD